MESLYGMAYRLRCPMPMNEIERMVWEMNRWRQFSLRFGFPPIWWVDILLIDTAFREIIEIYQIDISIWRFHRRAAQDESGHQISLLLYTNDGCFTAVKDALQNHWSVKILQREGFLKEFLPQEELGAEIEATSDRNWPSPLQRAWPFYIMGSCVMFLSLIRELTDTSFIPSEKSEIDELRKHYEEINDRLRAAWQSQGSHAFFHHLNAVFGYEPLVAQPRQIAGFLASF